MFGAAARGIMKVETGFFSGSTEPLVFNQDEDNLEARFKKLSKEDLYHLSLSLSALTKKLALKPGQMMQEGTAVSKAMENVFSNVVSVQEDKMLKSLASGLIEEIQELTKLFETMTENVRKLIATIDDVSLIEGYEKYKPDLIKYKQEYTKVSETNKDIKLRYEELQAKLEAREKADVDKVSHLEEVPNMTQKTFSCCFTMDPPSVKKDLQEFQLETTSLSNFSKDLKKEYVAKDDKLWWFRYYFSFFAYCCAEKISPNGYGTETYFYGAYLANYYKYCDHPFEFTKEGFLLKMGEKLVILDTTEEETSFGSKVEIKHM